MRFIKKILERGTITVPSDVREAIGVEEGDIVEFQIIRVVKRSGEAVQELDERAEQQHDDRHPTRSEV